MNNEEIERILMNTKFSMAVEGIHIIDEEEEAIRMMLRGDLNKDIYFASIREQAIRYSNEA